MSASTPSPAHETALRATSAEDLQRAYIWSINSAVESGGAGLADELADGYRRESHVLARLLRKAA
ncbi:MAG TPA: hypothetical protein VHZ96_28055 [Frankiaceae bacterium]|jgi:hypothetical protein|nr:hypothetical protein [Frankiaceae bacterium]